MNKENYYLHFWSVSSIVRPVIVLRDMKEHKEDLYVTLDTKKNMPNTFDSSIVKNIQMNVKLDPVSIR